MSQCFYPLDGWKHYKDLEEAEKKMFQAYFAMRKMRRFQ